MRHALCAMQEKEKIMLKNYLKIAIRNLKHSKGYTFINISGLAIGMACCLLIVLYIQDELSYDSFHTNADRIFRVVASTSEDGIPTNANGTFGAGPALKKDFPEVVDFVRIRKMGQGTKSYVGFGDQKFYEEWFFFADPSIFTVFTFPLIRGDAENALSNPHSIVITEAMAEKYFGDDDPMGRLLETDPYNTGEKMLFQVTGIAKNVPRNSHFHFDFLASYIDQKEDLTSFNGFWQHYTYVLLDDPGSAQTLEPKLLPFLQRHWREDPWYTNHLQPMKNIRLHSHLRSEIEPTGNIAYIYIFSIVAVIVLLIACINFINLSTARSAKRAKEVGLRKVVGAQKRQLMGQFLGESILVSLLGGICAMVLVALLLPVFNTIADKSVTLDFLMRWTPLAALLGIVIVVGMISGSYVSLILSSFAPAQTLKGSTSHDGRKNRLREGLVIFQFVLSIIMIICTLTAQKQLHFIQTQSTGYQRDEILVIPLNKNVRNGYAAVRNELLKNSAIRNTTTSSYVPTRGSMHNGLFFEGREEFLTQVVYFIDKEFVNTYGIEILEGHDILSETPNPSHTEFLISERTVTEAGYDSPMDALGKQVRYRDYQGTITGVIQDINLYSFHKEVYATVFLVTPIASHNYLSIRLDANRYGEALVHVQDVWKRVIPNFPLRYFFLDESFEQLHRAEQRLGNIFRYFGAMSVMVACMGLLGLAVFTAEQRTKEIGIRKTLGAPTFSIYLLLSKTFLKWVVFANLIAWPVAFLVMRQWLNKFAYRTGLDFWIFMLSAVMVFAVALLTVSWQCAKTALVNPVESLRFE
jgi:putative ABC transport system permease protein